MGNIDLGKNGNIMRDGHGHVMEIPVASMSVAVRSNEAIDVEATVSDFPSHPVSDDGKFAEALNALLHTFYRACNPAASLDLASAASAALNLSRDATATLGMQALLIAMLKDKDGNALQESLDNLVFNGGGSRIAQLAYFMADEMQNASGNAEAAEKAKATAAARPSFLPSMSQVNAQIRYASTNYIPNQMAGPLASGSRKNAKLTK